MHPTLGGAAIMKSIHIGVYAETMTPFKNEMTLIKQNIFSVHVYYKKSVQLQGVIYT